MSIADIAKQLADLSPEEKKALQDILGTKEEKPKPKSQPAKAKTVYFFRQVGRYEVDEIKKEGDKMVKNATSLPDRVIPADEKGASKYFWKGRGKYQYLGRSSGQVWKQSRNDGMTVGEAQAAEYEAMIANPDMTPPPNREKTFFAGKNMASVSRGQEISWGDGMKQIKE